jgi:hypothetical protein
MIALALVDALIIAFADETLWHQLNEGKPPSQSLSLRGKKPRPFWPHIFIRLRSFPK